MRLGEILFEKLGVPETKVSSAKTGEALTRAVFANLREVVDSGRPEVTIASDCTIAEFNQFRHVGVVQELAKLPIHDYERAWSALKETIERDSVKERAASRRKKVSKVEELADQIGAQIQQVVRAAGTEPVLGLDIGLAEAVSNSLPFLDIALSLKWTLRTDRAQDCRSQGQKLSALRRGETPHFAVVTMEPRPYMLNLLGGGSGDIDCVYHLALPELIATVEDYDSARGDKRWRGSRDTFRRLVDQGRVRDYSDLVERVQSLAGDV